MDGFFEVNGFVRPYDDRHKPSVIAYARTQGEAYRVAERLRREGLSVKLTERFFFQFGEDEMGMMKRMALLREAVDRFNQPGFGRLQRAEELRDAAEDVLAALESDEGDTDGSAH